MTEEAARDDRNEGECYGPFHPGFVCKDCAKRIRALEAELKKAQENQVTDYFIRSHVTRALYDEMKARAEVAEARLAEAERLLTHILDDCASPGECGRIDVFLSSDPARSGSGQNDPPKAGDAQEEHDTYSYPSSPHVLLRQARQHRDRDPDDERECEG